MSSKDRPRIQRAIEAHLPRKFLRDLWNRARFGPQAPLSDECIWIDPREVNYEYSADIVAEARRLRRHASGWVLGGNWDLSRRPLRESIKARAIREHFAEGRPWEETALYRHLLRRIEAGERPDELTSRAGLDARYAALDALWAELTTTGRLKPKSEMPDRYRREHGGILIHVGRDGTLMRSGGAAHRFAMARLAGLSRVPAQLGAVHRQAVESGLLERLRQPPQPG